LAIEVKQSNYLKYGKANSIRAFWPITQTRLGGLVLHSNGEVRWLDGRIISAPWTMITGNYPLVQSLSLNRATISCSDWAVSISAWAWADTSST